MVLGDNNDNRYMNRMFRIYEKRKRGRL